MANKRSITSKVEELENRIVEKKIETVLYDSTLPDHQYQHEGHRMDESEYQEWRKKLGPDVTLYIVEIWLNRPPVTCTFEVEEKKEDS